MIGAEHRYSPIEKRMLGICLRHSENATLLGGPNYTRHIKSLSFKIAYVEAIITEWSIDKMGHVALPI